mgnify:FL=1
MVTVLYLIESPLTCSASASFLSVAFGTCLLPVLVLPAAAPQILLETPEKRNACVRVILNFLEQESDDVSEVTPIPPLAIPEEKQIFLLPELVFRATGLTIAAFGFILGVSLMLGGRGQRR